jgi:UDP-glucose:(heptosyl)LPS alpha-1,3-glucosyltransferase
MPQPQSSVKEAKARRIIFVRQYYTPYGGAALILDRTLSALAARGLRVAVLGRNWLSKSDIEFIRCNPPAMLRAWRELLFARAACRRLARERDALVQSHDRISCCDIFRAGDGAHAAYLDARRRVESSWGRAAIALSPYHRNILRLEREMFASPRLKAVIANSNMVADDIVQYYGFARERIHLVPSGIDLDRFSPSARERHRAAMRRQLGIADETPVALLLGSGYAIKGLPAAIEAVARSRHKPEFWVVGRNKRFHSYPSKAARAGLSAGFRLLGPQADPVPYYAAADVMLMPSIYDAFPSTVLEALATGLPVVTSTRCGARDLAAKLDPALVRDALDVEGLAEALDRAFELARDPSTTARARAIALEYGIDAMVERLLAVYDKILGVQRP